jgi:hypothetical protein
MSFALIHADQRDFWKREYRADFGKLVGIARGNQQFHHLRPLKWLYYAQSRASERTNFSSQFEHGGQFDYTAFFIRTR